MCMAPRSWDPAAFSRTAKGLCRLLHRACRRSEVASHFIFSPALSLPLHPGPSHHTVFSSRTAALVTPHNELLRTTVRLHPTFPPVLARASDCPLPRPLPVSLYISSSRFVSLTLRLPPHPAPTQPNPTFAPPNPFPLVLSGPDSSRPQFGCPSAPGAPSFWSWTLWSANPSSCPNRPGAPSGPSSQLHFATNATAIAYSTAAAPRVGAL